MNDQLAHRGQQWPHISTIANLSGHFVHKTQICYHGRTSGAILSVGRALVALEPASQDHCQTTRNAGFAMSSRLGLACYFQPTPVRATTTMQTLVFEVLAGGTKVGITIAPNAAMALEQAHKAFTRRTHSKMDEECCDYDDLSVRRFPTFKRSLALVPAPRQSTTTATQLAA